MKTLYGIGNPLMDSIHHVPVGAIEDIGFVPGSMNLIDPEQHELIVQAGSAVRQTAGGSCANTLRGVAFLSRLSGSVLNTRFAGAVSHDTHGQQFESILQDSGIHSDMVKKGGATGTSTILVTPDGERTMFTCLGACRDFAVNDLQIEAISSSDILYVTGYMWDTSNQQVAVEKAMTAAKNAASTVMIDIADSFVVDRYRSELMTAVTEFADFVFCNIDELMSLFEVDERSQALVLAAALPSVVWLVKTGSEGCFVVADTGIQKIETQAEQALDTTGAGDAFAAGFVFSYSNGGSIEHSAAAANRLAGAIVAVEGCSYDDIPGGIISYLLG